MQAIRRDHCRGAGGVRDAELWTPSHVSITVHCSILAYWQLEPISFEIKHFDFKKRRVHEFVHSCIHAFIHSIIADRAPYRARCCVKHSRYISKEDGRGFHPPSHSGPAQLLHSLVVPLKTVCAAGMKQRSLPGGGGL